MSDLRFAFRQLLNNPGFSTVAVLTLALGIGANTALFSVVNAVLLRPLPYPEPDQLVQLRLDRSGSSSTVVGSTPFALVQAQSRSLAGIAAYLGGDRTLTGSGAAARVVTGSVTADFLPLLGVQPALGRHFTREEDTPNGPKAVLLSHGLWQSRFGGDPGVLGRTIVLDEQSHTVVGILPERFHYPERFDLWTPLALPESATEAPASAPTANEGMGLMMLKAIGRLKPGVTLPQAQAELQVIAQRLQSAATSAAPSEAGGEGGEGGEEEGRGGRLTWIGLHEQVVGDVKGPLLVLLGAVAFVLLIACANVANLLLARGAARQREMAVRAALGAGRLRIVRQLLTESVLLAVAGGALGLLGAFLSVRAMVSWSGASLPTLHGLGLDARALGFTFGVSVVTGLVFGLVPALQAGRADVNTALKEEGRGDAGGSRHRLRHLLVVSEMALALVLLIGAGLLIRSFSRLTAVDPGFRTGDVLTFQVTLAEGRSAAQKVRFTEQVVERLRSLPGVQAAAATDSLPLTELSRIGVADVEGRPPIDFRNARRSEVIPLSRPTVTPDYFNAMGIPLKSGRTLRAEDARSGAGSVVVNESFEKQYFPGQSAIGRRIRLHPTHDRERWQTVVGVVGNVRQGGLAGDLMPEVYSPVLEDAGGNLGFVLRVTGDPARLFTAVRDAVSAVEPDHPIHNLMTMEQRLADTTASPRMSMTLLGSFAAVALALAVVGIYGVMSHAVIQRRREIGVRMALGAEPGEVLGLVMAGGLRLTLLGVVVGLAGALALTRFLESQLYSVTTKDPVTFATVAVALTGVAMLACWLPARRAARVDPMVALRGE